jgi:hypothetical protein
MLFWPIAYTPVSIWINLSSFQRVHAPRYKMRKSTCKQNRQSQIGRFWLGHTTEYNQLCAPGNRQVE